MAKEQHLPLNPMKISGLCGRLMCCLKYEQEQYVCFRKEAPSRGTQVQTDVGTGVVVGYQVPKDALTLRFEDGSYGDVPIDGCSCGGAPCRRLTASGEIAVMPEMGGSPVDSQADTTTATCPPIPPHRDPELVFEENGDTAAPRTAETVVDPRADRLADTEGETAAVGEGSGGSASASAGSASSDGPPAESPPPDGDSPRGDAPSGETPGRDVTGGDVTGGEGRPGGGRRGRSRGRRRRPRSGGSGGSGGAPGSPPA